MRPRQAGRGRTTMEHKGFIASLLDLSFEQCITTKMIKVLYILAMIGSVFAGLTVLGIGIAEGGFVSIFFGLIGGIITAALSLVGSRLWLELIIVIFRIADHTGEMARKPSPEVLATPPAPSF